MAGIGFHLHKLVSGDTYTHAATGYLSSVIITAGPWLTSVLSLGLLGAIGIPSFTQADYTLFMATLTYAFCASLIVTGGPQMVITRYLADRLYLEDWRSVAPTCNGVLLFVAPLLAIATPFLLFAPFDWRYRLLVVTLFIILCLIWLMNIFLSAARDYAKIVSSFAIGYAVSFGATMAFSQVAGLIGGLCGYTLGQALLMTLLIAQVYREFEPADTINLAFLAYGRQYWDLLLLGTFYTAGVWIDNVIHWQMPGSHVVAGFYRTNNVYDTMKLLAYMTTIFASAMFLVHIETSFAQHYRAFYLRVEEKGTLAEIRQAKQGMTNAVRVGLANVLKLQVIVTGAVILFAPDIVAWLGLPSKWTMLLRVSVFAANSQFTVLMAIVLLLYLDQRRTALRVSVLFVIGNIVLTLLVIPLGPQFDGFGYLIAATLCAIAALVLLYERLRRLEYLTFMLQPIAQPAIPDVTARPAHRKRWSGRWSTRLARTSAPQTAEAP